MFSGGLNAVSYLIFYLLCNGTEVGTVTQTDDGKGCILKGESCVAGHNLQGSCAGYRERCIEGKGYLLIGSSEGVACNCSGYGSSVQRKLDCKRGGYGGSCINQGCAGKERLIDTGLGNLHVGRTGRMGNGSAGYQWGFSENQGAVSRSGLCGGVHGCQNFRCSSSSGFPAGNDEIKDCVFCGTGIGYGCFCARVACGNGSYCDGCSGAGRPCFTGWSGRPFCSGGPGCACFTVSACGAGRSLRPRGSRGPSSPVRACRSGRAFYSRGSGRPSGSGRPGGSGWSGWPSRASGAGSALGACGAGCPTGYGKIKHMIGSAGYICDAGSSTGFTCGGIADGYGWGFSGGSGCASGPGSSCGASSSSCASGSCGSGWSSGAGRGDVKRKVAITLKNQGEIKNKRLSHYAESRPGKTGRLFCVVGLERRKIFLVEN